MSTKSKKFLAGTILLIALAVAGYILLRESNTSNTTVTQTPPETFSSEMHGLHDVAVLQEKAFLEGMIPHHQEAVAAAEEVLARSENAEVRKLAESISSAQEKEITNMKLWYQTWYGQPYKDDDSYKAMMPDLSTLNGKELDKTFLEGMIEHHMGALMMAQQVSQKIEHAEIAELTKAIAETQSSEIIEMRILLKTL